MLKTLKSAVAALALAGLMAGAAEAQDPPAVARLTDAGEKAKLKERIAAAQKEGMVNYINTVIQPATNDALTAAFRTYYGLPASFKVGYLTQAPGNVITRMQQEIAANKYTLDVGSVASPPWVHARIKDGKIAKYDSPEYADLQAELRSRPRQARLFRLRRCLLLRADVERRGDEVQGHIVEERARDRAPRAASTRTILRCRIPR